MRPIGEIAAACPQLFNELTYLDGNKEWHSHGPQAFDGLAVDNDYRDDAQSASVVCRNQLWNPFSVVFVLRAGARSDVSVAQPVVSFVSRAVRHASLRRDVDLQDRHTSLEPGSLHRSPHHASRIGLNPCSCRLGEKKGQATFKLKR